MNRSTENHPSDAAEIYRTKIASKTHYMLLLVKSPYLDILPVPVALNEGGMYEKQYFTRFEEIAERRKEVLESENKKNQYQIVPVRIPGFEYIG